MNGKVTAKPASLRRSGTLAHAVKQMNNVQRKNPLSSRTLGRKVELYHLFNVELSRTTHSLCYAARLIGTAKSTVRRPDAEIANLGRRTDNA